MICRAIGGFGLRALKTQSLQIQLINKDIDHPHWVIFGNVLVQALGKQRGLRAVLTFDVSLHGGLASGKPAYFIPIAYVEEAFSHELDPKVLLVSVRFWIAA